MDSSSGLPVDRLAVGQLLGRLLHHFRVELFSKAQDAGQFLDIRFPHLQIWGNVGVDGIRLTALAAKAQLSLAACSELVDELQSLGYLRRRPDPSDGRAKLIFPTAQGRTVLSAAGRAVGELEQHWRHQVPAGAFDEACRVLDELLNQLDRAATSPGDSP